MEGHAFADMEGIDQAVIRYFPGFSQAGQGAAILEVSADQTLADGVDDVHAAEAVPEADIEGIAHRFGAED